MSHFPHKQHGVALLVSLVLLLLLTLLAIAAARTSSLQQRMASNAQQQNSAFQAAETGIRAWLSVADAESTKQEWPALAISTGKVSLPNTSDTYEASAAIPGNCWNTVPSYSLDANENRESFQYACFDIGSTGESEPATATHNQGHLVRY